MRVDEGRNSWSLVANKTKARIVVWGGGEEPAWWPRIWATSQGGRRRKKNAKITKGTSKKYAPSIKQAKSRWIEPNVVGVGGRVIAGRPGGVSSYPRAWYRSVSWVRVPSSAYSYKFVRTFSCAQIDSRKARERELAALDEKSTSSGIAGPYAR